jgi:hypothetical protein
LIFSTHPDGVDHVLRRGHRLAVRAFRGFLGPLPEVTVFVDARGRPDLDERDAAVGEPLDDVDEPVLGGLGGRRLERQQEDEPVTRPDAGHDTRHADAGRPEHREDLREARVVVEVEPEASLVDEDELVRDA